MVRADCFGGRGYVVVLQRQKRGDRQYSRGRGYVEDYFRGRREVTDNILETGETWQTSLDAGEK